MSNRRISRARFASVVQFGETWHAKLEMKNGSGFVVGIAKERPAALQQARSLLDARFPKGPSQTPPEPGSKNQLRQAAWLAKKGAAC